MTEEISNRKPQQQEMPGGSNSRGPEYGTVGEIQADVPPYDELRGSASAEGAEGVHRAFDATNAPAPGPDVPVSAEERTGMSSTETNPEPPLGVGKSHGKGGEELAPDRTDTDTQGESGRPAGKADQRSESGISPKPSTTPGSPNLQTGDQGG